MESCESDVQRLSLLIKAAFRNSTSCLRHVKKEKGGSVKLKVESTAGRMERVFQVLLHYNLMLLQKKMSGFFLLVQQEKKISCLKNLLIANLRNLSIRCNMQLVF